MKNKEAIHVDHCERGFTRTLNHWLRWRLANSDIHSTRFRKTLLALMPIVFNKAPIEESMTKFRFDFDETVQNNIISARLAERTEKQNKKMERLQLVKDLLHY